MDIFLQLFLACIVSLSLCVCEDQPRPNILAENSTLHSLHLISTPTSQINDWTKSSGSEVLSHIGLSKKTQKIRKRPGVPSFNKTEVYQLETLYNGSTIESDNQPLDGNKDSNYLNMSINETIQETNSTVTLSNSKIKVVKELTEKINNRPRPSFEPIERVNISLINISDFSKDDLYIKKFENKENISSTSTTKVNYENSHFKDNLNKTLDSKSIKIMSKPSTASMGDISKISYTNIALISSIIVIICICALIGLLAYKRIYAYWYRRHYSRVDFLIDGLYEM